MSNTSKNRILKLRKKLRSAENLSEVARKAEVSHVTVIRIRDGKIQNPGIFTVEMIETALRKISAAGRSRRQSTDTAA